MKHLRACLAAAGVLCGGAMIVSYELGHSQGWSAGPAAGVRDESTRWVAVQPVRGNAVDAGVYVRRSSPLRNMVDIRQVRNVNYIAQPFPPFPPAGK